MGPFKVHFTHPATVEAAKRGISLETLEAYIREDMRSEGYHEDAGAECWPPNLIFHTVDYDQPNPWLVSGIPDEGAVLVDSATYKDGKKLESGPFAGKTFQFPIGDDDAD